MKLAHINIRSLVGKIIEFKEHIVVEDYDIIGVTETWLGPNISDNSVSIKGYKFIRLDRPTRGGGVGMYIKETFTYTLLQIDNSVEQIWVKIIFNKISWCIGYVYRAPGDNFNNFIDIFENTLSTVIPITEQLICMGDFNVDLLNTNTQYSKNFMSLLDSVGLGQIIQESTRITQNTSNTFWFRTRHS